MIPDHYIYGNQLSIAVIDASSSSTGVIYTDSASGGSGRPMRILGSLLFEGGLTPGTWVNPNYVLLAGRGAKGPGDVVQTGVWCQSTKSSVTITTALPIDNTRPLFSTTEYGNWTNIDFTPDSGTNYIEVEFSGYVSAPAGTTTADYVGVGVNIANSDMSAMHIDRSMGADIPQLIVLHAAIRAPVGGINQNNLQISFMCTHTGTLVVNGIAANALFGGAGRALYKVSEIVG
jgi:hypothetical protein